MFGLIYTLPNFFGEAPAVQVSSVKATVKVDTALLQEAAERSLFEAIGASRPVFDKHFAAHDYTAALKSLAPLKTPVDAFFDSVMVNAEDPKLRANRLALLADLHGLMNKVADLSKLAT